MPSCCLSLTSTQEHHFQAILATTSLPSLSTFSPTIQARHHERGRSQPRRSACLALSIVSPHPMAGLTRVVASIPEAISGPRPVPFVIASHHHGGHLRSQLLNLVKEHVPLGAKAPACAWSREGCGARRTCMAVMLDLWTVAVPGGNELGREARHGCGLMSLKAWSMMLASPIVAVACRCDAM